MEAEGSLPRLQQSANYLFFERVVQVEPGLTPLVIFFNSQGFSMRSFQLLTRTPSWKTVPCRLFATACSVYLFSGILNGCVPYPSNEVTPVLHSKKCLPLKICCVYPSPISNIQDSDYEQNMPYMYIYIMYIYVCVCIYMCVYIYITSNICAVFYLLLLT